MLIVPSQQFKGALIMGGVTEIKRLSNDLKLNVFIVDIEIKKSVYEYPIQKFPLLSLTSKYFRQFHIF